MSNPDEQNLQLNNKKKKKQFIVEPVMFRAFF